MYRYSDFLKVAIENGKLPKSYENGNGYILLSTYIRQLPKEKNNDWHKQNRYKFRNEIGLVIHRKADFAIRKKIREEYDYLIQLAENVL